MLEQFFNPQSVAIIGASHTPGKVGYAIVENFVNNGYRGSVYPVNPNTESIMGLKVYASVKEIPEPVELAVVAVRADVVPSMLKQCAKQKIKNIIIVSGGFSESGTAGKKLEDECKKIIAKSKLRVIGPNCVGVYDSTTAVDTIFLSRSRLDRPTAGSISLVIQSGAVGSSLIDWLAERNIGISKFVSYGNGADVNEVDALEYLADDEKTKVIVMYLEGIKSDGKKFVDVLKKITKKKPVIVLKAGKTDKGTQAVVSHTGSLAGSAKIYSGVFKQTGVIEAANLQEVFDFARAFQQPLPAGNKVAIITNGGGFGVLATDECTIQGLQLPAPSKKNKNKLQKKFPAHVIISNPMDLTGDSTVDGYRTVIEECMQSKEYDGIIAIILFQVPTLRTEITDVVVEMSKKYNKPILCCSVGGRFTKKIAAKIEAGNVPVYSTPEAAAKSFGAMVKYGEWLKKI